MKPIRIALIIIAASALLVSCGGGSGEDVGDGTVDIEYATEAPDATPEELRVTAAGMTPVFKALIHSIGVYGGYMPADAGFVGETVSSALYYMYGSSQPADGAAKAVYAAAFGGQTDAPPDVSPMAADEPAVEITDVISDNDGFIAYLNIIGDDGSAMDIYTANMTWQEDEAAAGFGFAFSVGAILRMTIGTSGAADTTGA